MFDQELLKGRRHISIAFRRFRLRIPLVEIEDLQGNELIQFNAGKSLGVQIYSRPV
jgi:hypothetical protein